MVNLFTWCSGLIGYTDYSPFKLSKDMLKQALIICCTAIAALLPLHSYAHKHETKNGHELVQDVYKPGADVEFDEDQDEVYDAVKKGYIRPFSEMYAAVERDLHGRIIEVELEEDDDVWIYELKLNYKNNIIKVEYNAETLEMLLIKGRHFKKALKNLEDQ